MAARQPPPRHPRPNPYGAPPPREQPRRAPQPPPSRRWALAVGIAAGVVLLLAAALGVSQFSASGGALLDVHHAEAGVAQILSDPINGYGANDVAAVVCNRGKNPQVQVGATFTCEVDINGTIRRVNVEFTDDDGTYAVDGPR